MTTAVETMVRMGELAVSSDARAVLTTIGLGSCIGLVLLDGRGIAGLAHIVLPSTEGRGAGGEVGKFADTAVPELVSRMRAKGARRGSLEAALVGGASMFAFRTGGLDIGGRNEAATRNALAALGIPVRAADTGGTAGRTVRVRLDRLSVTARVAGKPEQELLAARKVPA